MTTTPTPQIVMLNTSEIVPGHNDRTIFDQAALMELADSVREHGLLQPISVRLLCEDGEETGLYQIIAGERRYRACTEILHWSEIPAIIHDADDEQAAALMLAENVARADLDPIDEARAYQSRIDVYGWSIEDCALRAGVSAIRVQFRLKLLKLNADIQHLIRSSSLTLGYAQILSDAGLDRNRQLLAVSKLRDNANPNPTWFRSVVNTLHEQQAQAGMFGDDLLLAAQPINIPSTPIGPPHPATDKAPKIGKSLPEIVKHQIEYWQRAAEEWAAIGKPFKRQECQAAAMALQALL